MDVTQKKAPRESGQTDVERCFPEGKEAKFRIQRDLAVILRIH
jgi:hypothetical protein